MGQESEHHLDSGYLTITCVRRARSSEVIAKTIAIDRESQQRTSTSRDLPALLRSQSCFRNHLYRVLYAL